MRVDQLVPEVYYKESRDFSYIGRVFEIVFNYMKLQADLVGIDLANENINADIIELAAKTVGFETKHTYINKDLLAVVNNFSSIVREKGTLHSVERAARLLSSCHQLNIAEDAVTIDLKDPCKLIINLPYESTDVILFEDLLNYILPAGWLYEIEYSDKAFKTQLSIINEIDDVETKSHNTGTVTRIVDTSNVADIIPDDKHADIRYTWYTGHVVTDTSGLDLQDGTASDIEDDATETLP